ncbi:MAG: TetR/AcrR family transcriptional regulator [Clostridiales bacterium]|nr:TetR/AcrR family transcriptional regulator [Clostridiales bacterium]
MKKSDKTKQQILEKSKLYFSQYGYSRVTMKDICDICDMSRGGLYHYFGSTKEIFIELLSQDKDEKGEMQCDSIKKKIPAELMFRWFLQDRKHTGIMGSSEGFTFAIQEFVHKETDQQDYMQKRRMAAQNSMVILLRYGQDTGEFKAFDTDAIALTVLLLLDSLEVNSNVLNITEEEIDKQLQIICDLIISK